MLYVGCHLSASNGNLAMVRTAQELGGNTFAYFTRNPRGSKAKPENPADNAAAVAAMKEGNFGPLVAHAAYTMNLCTADPGARAFAAEVLCPAISITCTRAVMWARVRKWPPGRSLMLSSRLWSLVTM